MPIKNSLWSLLNTRARLSCFLKLKSGWFSIWCLIVSIDTFEEFTNISFWRNSSALLSKSLKPTAIIKKNSGDKTKMRNKYSYASFTLSIYWFFWDNSITFSIIWSPLFLSRAKALVPNNCCAITAFKYCFNRGW